MKSPLIIHANKVEKIANKLDPSQEEHIVSYFVQSLAYLIKKDIAKDVKEVIAKSSYTVTEIAQTIGYSDETGLCHAAKGKISVEKYISLMDFYGLECCCVKLRKKKALVEVLKYLNNKDLSISEIEWIMDEIKSESHESDLLKEWIVPYLTVLYCLTNAGIM